MIHRTRWLFTSFWAVFAAGSVHACASGSSDEAVDDATQGAVGGADGGAGKGGAAMNCPPIKAQNPATLGANCCPPPTQQLFLVLTD